MSDMAAWDMTTRWMTQAEINAEDAAAKQRAAEVREVERKVREDREQQAFGDLRVRLAAAEQKLTDVRPFLEDLARAAIGLPEDSLVHRYFAEIFAIIGPKQGESQ